MCYCQIDQNGTVTHHRASQMLKCHGYHRDFHGVPKSFGESCDWYDFFCCLQCWTAENFGHVTATLRGHLNQNFGRPLMCHSHCQIDWNGTVYKCSCLPNLHLRQGPICNPSKGTSIIVDTCRIIKSECIPKTLIIIFSNWWTIGMSFILAGHFFCFIH